jgi:O-antigen/teichoic acid export membrane protein
MSLDERHMLSGRRIGFGGLGKLLDLIRRDAGDTGVARRGALFAFGVRVVSAGIAFLSQILLARWMGVFEYGVFTYVWILIHILGAVSSFGLNTSVLRFVPQYHETGQFGLARGFLRGSAAFTLTFSTFLALAGAGLVYLLDGRIDAIYVAPLLLAFVCLPMFAITDLQDGLARAHSWIDLALVPPYIVRPTLLLLLLAGAVAFGGEPSAKTAMLAAIGATWATAIGQLLVLKRRLHRDIDTGVPRYRFGFWLKISFPIFLLEGFYLLLTYADVMIINAVMTPRDVAIYFAVVKTTSLIEFVYFAVTAAVAHKFSKYYAAGRTEDLRRFLKDTINWTFWPSLAGAIFILGAGVPLLWLFGPEFTAGYPLMFLLVIGLLARASTGPVEALMNMAGRQNICATVLFTATMFNVGLNLVLIPRYGLTGAAIATAVSLTMVSAILFVMARRKLGVHAFVFGGLCSDAPDKAAV